MPAQPSDLVEQLRRHLRFIERSCRAYDNGSIDEALRISVSLRVLFHDTVNSTSLLTHLGRRTSVHLISTIGLGQTAQQMGTSVIIYLPLMLTLEGVRAPLGEGRPARVVTCDDWWNEIIMSQAERFSRRDVVLSSANQDGGAHVDSRPSRKTAELKEGVGAFTKTIGGVTATEKLTDHHFPLLRQLGYELLNSPEITDLA